MTTARDVVDMLRRHYLPAGREAGGIFAPEIQAPTSNRRADLIWQGCTVAGGHELVGHEIKVSRVDLLNELAEPAKSDPWQRYCDRWWLVLSDPTLVNGLEIPPSWGVMSPPSGRRTRSMTVVAPAPQLKPIEQAPALKTLATWLHWRVQRAEADRQQAESYLNRERDLNRLLQIDLATSGRQIGPVERMVADIVAGMGGVANDRIGTWEQSVGTEDIVAALKDFASIEAKREEAQRSLGYLTRQLTGLRDSVVRAIKESGVAA